jgi:hypothetical protein
MRTGQVSYVADLGYINGRRERHSFKTEGKADTFARLKRTKRSNQGAKAIMLPASTREDAIAAEKLIKERDVTLVEAGQYYLDHVRITVPQRRRTPTTSRWVQDHKKERSFKHRSKARRGFRNHPLGTRLSGWIKNNTAEQKATPMRLFGRKIFLHLNKLQGGILFWLHGDEH